MPVDKVIRFSRVASLWISFFNISVVSAQSLSHAQLFATLWTVACQAPLSMGSSRQECWSGLPFPSPGDLPSLGIEPLSPMFPAFQADSLPTEPSDMLV